LAAIAGGTSGFGKKTFHKMMADAASGAKRLMLKKF
jgi:hypothetical protein